MSASFETNRNCEHTTMMQNAQKGMAKWTVRILLGLLIVSFAMWGVADYVTAPVNPPVAHVGDREISSHEFLNESQRRINIVRQQQNRQIDQRTAIAIGLYSQTLSAMIDRNALLDTADGWNLGVSDDVVVSEIRNDPAFQSATGNFDRIRFESVLRNAGFGENQFIQSLREDIINRQIESSVTAGLDRGQYHLAKAILAYQLETRDIRMIEVPNDKIAAAATPTEADLTAFHEENSDQFSSQALRSARVLHIKPSELAAEIIIDEQPIEKAYEDRLGEFTTEATRAIRQAIFPDEAAAAAALERINGGATFETVVEDATKGPPIDLGVVTAGDLPGAVGDAAFSADPGSVTGPVQSAFGWHLVEIGESTPSIVQPLDDVRDQIVADLKLEAALEQMIDLSNQIEDELAGGATAQDVATSIGHTLTELPAVDRSGVDAAGESRIGELPTQTLSLLFATSPGDELSAAELSDSSLLLVETLDLREPALRPFAEVREEVTAAWQAQNLARIAADERQKLVDRLKSGTTFEALAAELGLEIVSEAGITRQSGAARLAGEAREAIFSAAVGESVGGASPLGGGQILVIADAITLAEIGENDEQVEGLASTIGEAFADDVRSQYLQSLREDVGYSVMQPAFRAAVDPNGIYLN
jgi:peptidyl-prolyl cis-trans isomerase D